MRITTYGPCVSLLFQLTAAAFADQNQTVPVNQLAQNLQAILGGISTGINGALENQQFEQVIELLQSVSPLAPSPPLSVEDALQRLQAVNAAQPASAYDFLAKLRALNLIDSIDSLLLYAKGFADAEDGSSNVNAPPPTEIYPKKLSCDAPYSTSEDALRSAIYIPTSFTFGKKPPVILFPGTGATGYTTYKGNFIPLLQNSDFADPVWVNVPDSLLDDAQINAEYAAYAINYISAICDQNVTVTAWSQGNIDFQWAFKFWPSTRLVTTDHIAISPDYAGTINANLIAPPGAPSPPSVLQQRYLQSSDFITALRADDGDSGYVPTTTIYSIFDEIVQPQQGVGASAFLNDARAVGVTNYEVQQVCAGQLAGSVYTHEGVLFNPLAFALFRDAMQNDGPGRIERLDLSIVCSQYLTPGLDLGDLIVTENVVAIALLGILLYDSKVLVEPPIKSYAASPPVADLEQCRPATTTSVISTSATSATLSTTSSKMISMDTTTSTSAATTTSTTIIATTPTSTSTETTKVETSTTSTNAVTQSSTITDISSTLSPSSSSSIASSGSLTTSTEDIASMDTRTTTTPASATSKDDPSATASTSITTKSSAISSASGTNSSTGSTYTASTSCSSSPYSTLSTITTGGTSSTASIYPTVTFSSSSQSISSGSYQSPDSSYTSSAGYSQVDVSSAYYTTLPHYATPASSDSTGTPVSLSTTGRFTFSMATYNSGYPTAHGSQSQTHSKSGYTSSEPVLDTYSSSMPYFIATRHTASSSYETGSVIPTTTTMRTTYSFSASAGQSSHPHDSSTVPASYSTHRSSSQNPHQFPSATFSSEGLTYSSYTSASTSVAHPSATTNEMLHSSTASTIVTTRMPSTTTTDAITTYTGPGSNERGRSDLSIVIVLAALAAIYAV